MPVADDVGKCRARPLRDQGRGPFRLPVEVDVDFERSDGALLCVGSQGRRQPQAGTVRPWISVFRPPLHVRASVSLAGAFGGGGKVGPPPLTALGTIGTRRGGRRAE